MKNEFSRTARLSFSVLLFFLSSTSMAYQSYTGEDNWPAIDPKIKNFTFYISPTYWDLLSDRERDTSNFLVQSVKDSFAVLERDSAHVGLTFSFGGFKDPDDLSNIDYGEEFNGKIYVDFASRIFDFSVGAPAGRTKQKLLTPGATSAVGGIVYMNGKFLNYHHPKIENYSTIIHETLHVLGVGHSTNASSIMAYTENWYPRLSVDDKAALSTIYGLTSGASPTVTASLGASAAGGIEIVWINTVTGRSQIAVADSAGKAKIYALPAGTYVLAARELTPTGPCYSNPTRGFLTSFYVNDSSATNTYASAGVITLTEGASPSYVLKLISGVKKFDCQYIYALWCETTSDCIQNRTKPGANGRVNFMNDLTTTNHNTNTNTASGAHSAIAVSTIGSQTPFTIGTASLGDGGSVNVGTGIGYNQKNYTNADFRVAASATEGTYAALCTAQGETALMSSMTEVMSVVGSVTNELMWPDYVAEMSAADSPRNYIELKAREAPAQPKKAFGIACGVLLGAKAQDLSPTVLFLMLVVLPWTGSLIRLYVRKAN